jgi:hypothetical protein
MPDEVCTCTEAGEDIWCITHGANTVILALRDENERLAASLGDLLGRIHRLPEEYRNLVLSDAPALADSLSPQDGSDG